MVSSQARFTDPRAPKSDVPGPGHYGPHFVYGNLLKQVCVFHSARFPQDGSPKALAVSTLRKALADISLRVTPAHCLPRATVLNRTNMVI